MGVLYQGSRQAARPPPTATQPPARRDLTSRVQPRPNKNAGNVPSTALPPLRACRGWLKVKWPLADELTPGRSRVLTLSRSPEQPSHSPPRLSSPPLPFPAACCSQPSRAEMLWAPLSGRVLVSTQGPGFRAQPCKSKTKDCWVFFGFVFCFFKVKTTGQGGAGL